MLVTATGVLPQSSRWRLRTALNLVVSDRGKEAVTVIYQRW